ncbi:LPXTG cell wall anchor domain-containing protein [Cytobacillus sp. Sa5YUA1]|uniref:LPXTG cell wall anchor domain-containing protein n=1 Tax=Cytobacillus stercorigallinarum TaxID=2762240 RepID=A0ABR8QLP5_9BACI|nr:LPXTG cell wall anchor domain-containing protein [Cytobacillus stercorigallinarum]MBD7936424.1 LPXTG cell wall anchor domain-containing protein [Cytobacillus stercorigallinarum]
MKKQIIILSILISLLIFLPTLSNAESNGEYNSKSRVGFYGEYIYEHDKNPSPETSGLEKHSSPSTLKEFNRLPQTGEQTGFLHVLFGFCIISLAILLLRMNYSQ